MPTMDVAVALWNRDTHKKQMDPPATRLQNLKKALQACEIQFGSVLGSQRSIKGLFVAPEYYFAASSSGVGHADGSFSERGVSESQKDMLVAELLALSKKYPKVLMLPGTIAYTKPLHRSATGDDRFKRDPLTQQRTTTLKTGDRLLNVATALKSAYARGGRIPTELLRNKVRDRLLAELRATNPTALLAPGQLDSVVYTIVNDDAQLTAVFGTTAGLYRTVASPNEALKAMIDGTTTSVLKNTAFVFLNGQVRFKYNKVNDFHESLSDGGKTVFCPGVKSGFTTIDGVDIGLEICLDHAAAQLQNTPLPLSGAPMLHILTSASVEPKVPIVRDGGYFIHASSNAGWAGVHKRTAGTYQRLEPLAKLDAGGDPLDVYRITLTVA